MQDLVFIYNNSQEFNVRYRFYANVIHSNRLIGVIKDVVCRTSENNIVRPFNLVNDRLVCNQLLESYNSVHVSKEVQVSIVCNRDGGVISK